MHTLLRIQHVAPGLREVLGQMQDNAEFAILNMCCTVPLLHNGLCIGREK